MPESDFTGTVFICHDYPSAISAGAEFNHVRIVEKIIKNSCIFFCLRADDLLNLWLEEEDAVKSIENIRYNNALMVRLSIAGPRFTCPNGTFN